MMHTGKEPYHLARLLFFSLVGYTTPAHDTVLISFPLQHVTSYDETWQAPRGLLGLCVQHFLL
jgi:hypothetical protein